MLLKFNNIRDLSDARYAAAAMAEWIGFTVGQQDSLNPAAIKEIVSWCAGPKLILEIADTTDINTILNYCSFLPVDGVEIKSEIYSKWSQNSLPKNLQIILKGTLQGNGKDDFWYTTNALTAKENHICLVNPELINLEEIALVKPKAVSLNCFDEEDGMFKNYDVWSDFIEGLQEL